MCSVVSPFVKKYLSPDLPPQPSGASGRGQGFRLFAQKPQGTLRSGVFYPDKPAPPDQLGATCLLSLWRGSCP